MRPWDLPGALRFIEAAGCILQGGGNLVIRFPGYVPSGFGEEVAGVAERYSTICKRKRSHQAPYQNNGFGSPDPDQVIDDSVGRKYRDSGRSAMRSNGRLQSASAWRYRDSRPFRKGQFGFFQSSPARGWQAFVPFFPDFGPQRAVTRGFRDGDISTLRLHRQPKNLSSSEHGGMLSRRFALHRVTMP